MVTPHVINREIGFKKIFNLVPLSGTLATRKINCRLNAIFMLPWVPLIIPRESSINGAILTLVYRPITRTEDDTHRFILRPCCLVNMTVVVIHEPVSVNAIKFHRGRSYAIINIKTWYDYSRRKKKSLQIWTWPSQFWLIWNQFLLPSSKAEVGTLQLRYVSVKTNLPLMSLTQPVLNDTNAINVGW